MPTVSARSQRQQQQQQQQRRDSWLAFLVGVLVASLALGAYSLWQYLTNPTTLAFRQVEIKGVLRHTSVQQVQQSVLQNLHGGFFALDRDTLQQQLLQLPWVSQVSVHRRWPPKLLIIIDEHQPLARWQDNQLLSVTGQLFSPPAAEQETAILPWLSGPADQIPRILAAYRALNAALVPLGLTLSRLTLSTHGDWTVVLSNQLTVVLSEQQRTRRWQRFVRLYPQLVQDPQRLPASVDLRYPNGFAVAWQHP